jgi:hypothetical protein
LPTRPVGKVGAGVLDSAAVGRVAVVPVPDGFSVGRVVGFSDGKLGALKLP